MHVRLILGIIAIHLVYNNACATHPVDCCDSSCITMPVRLTLKIIPIQLRHFDHRLSFLSVGRMAVDLDLQVWVGSIPPWMSEADVLHDLAGYTVQPSMVKYVTRPYKDIAGGIPCPIQQDD